jgi:hypothetical protein
VIFPYLQSHAVRGMPEWLYDQPRIQEKTSMQKPLEDVRILDMGQSIALPHCTMLLADLGAKVT